MNDDRELAELMAQGLAQLKGGEILTDNIKLQVPEIKERKSTPLFYESMTQAVHPGSGCRIRVWRREAELPEYADNEIINIINKIPEGLGMQETLRHIEQLERITAIELTDRHGLGCVVYYEW